MTGFDAVIAFLKSHRRAVGAIFGVILLGGGALALGVGTPTVQTVDNEFGAVNNSTTTIKTDLVVTNPNPLNLNFSGVSVDYQIAMNDVDMARGQHTGFGLNQGNSTINFTTYMSNEKIPPWWVSHIKNGEQTTIEIDTKVHSKTLGMTIARPQITRTINTSLTDALNTTQTRPINANQPVVSDPIMYLNETNGSWGTVTAEETPIEMELVVYNPKSTPLTLTELGYDITMNGVPVGEGVAKKELIIPPHSSKTIDAETIIANQHLDEWWASHLKRNQTTTLELSFYARVDLSTLGAGTVSVPLDTVSQTFETDIFGTKSQDSAGNGSSGEGTPVREPTATSTTGNDGDEETDTSFPDPLNTPTPRPEDGSTSTMTPNEATPTDDGGLLGSIVIGAPIVG